MARIELLLSTLVFGVVYSAPVNVSTEASSASPSSSSSSSVSAFDRDFRSSPPPESRSLPPWAPRVPPRIRSTVSPFPSRQEASSSSQSPLEKDQKPTLSKKALSRDKADERKESPSDRDGQAEKFPRTEAPESHTIRHVVRSLLDGDGVSQNPGDSQSGGRRPLPFSAYRSSSQQPANSTQSSSEVSSDGGVRPNPLLPHIYVGPASREASVSPSSSESTPSFGGQSTARPQDAVRQQPSQADDRRPFLVLRDVASLPYGIPSRSGDADSDSPDERSYPVIAEEVAEVPAVVPQNRYPPVLVPSVLPAQDASPYDAAQIVPLSVEPVSEEPSEESSDDPPQQRF